MMNKYKDHFINISTTTHEGYTVELNKIYDKYKKILTELTSIRNNVISSHDIPVET